MPTTPAALGRHWVYLDDQRTHEVHALIEPRTANEFLFSLTEMPAGSRDATEVVVEEMRLDTTEKLRLALKQLEERLSLQGTYYRASATDMRWQLLAPAPAARKLDMRAHEVAIPGAPIAGAKMGFHHFHAGGLGRDMLLVSLPRFDLKGQPRSILAQFDFDYPNVEEGEVKVLHTRLGQTTLRSQLVKQHLDLPTRGYAKLIDPKDYAGAFGAKWLDRTNETFRMAASRVLNIGRRPTVEPAPLKLEEYAEASIAALTKAIDSDRVRGLRDRFLSPTEARAIVSGGELGIRRFVQNKQRRADHHVAFDLSVLQSALLVEYGLQAHMQSLLDEEGAKLLRYAGR
ncbi:MAG: hypothetical protein WDA16_10530 [Candidatus Thermoplasmatota archaeon]